MAVTQQIARLSESDLETCGRDVAALESLISYKLCRPDDHLDLNWAPAVLRQYFGASHQRPEAELALHMSCNGARLVHPECRREVNGYQLDSDIACMSCSEVAQVAAGFQVIDWDRLVGWLPRDRKEACEAIKMELTEHPDNVVPSYLRDLVEFYNGAARKSFCTAMWWD